MVTLVVFPNNGHFDTKYHVGYTMVIFVINLTVNLTIQRSFWYGLPVILKNIGHFDNHS